MSSALDHIWVIEPLILSSWHLPGVFCPFPMTCTKSPFFTEPCFFGIGGQKENQLMVWNFLFLRVGRLNISPLRMMSGGIGAAMTFSMTAEMLVNWIWCINSWRELSYCLPVFLCLAVDGE